MYVWTSGSIGYASMLEGCTNTQHRCCFFSMNSKSDRHASYEVREGLQSNISLILIEFDMTWGRFKLKFISSVT